MGEGALYEGSRGEGAGKTKKSSLPEGEQGQR
jgi:hypothetical protein